MLPKTALPAAFVIFRDGDRPENPSPTKGLATLRKGKGCAAFGSQCKKKYSR
jgi:hypothetical protein